MKKKLSKSLLLLSMFYITLTLAYADDTVPSHYQLPQNMAFHGERIIAINPMAGWNDNTFSMGVKGNMPPIKKEDGEPEYALLLLYVSQRFAINNITFYTPPYNGDIWGNVLNFSVYGKSDSALSWSAGGVWTWHKLSMPHSDITINAPFMKFGIIIRIPDVPVTINPYLGYGIEYIEHATHEDEEDMMLYGISVNAMLYKLHINVKYLLYDGLDSSGTYQTFSSRIIMPLIKHTGWSVWAQYMEQEYTKDYSIMTGPIWLF